MTTALYGALLGLMFVALSLRTLALRRKLKVAVGDGNNPQLQRATRVHANFAEYVPIALILIYLLESQASVRLWIHCLCIALLIGRLSHAYGVSQVREDYRYRIFGMILTLGVIISASLRILISYVYLIGT